MHASVTDMLACETALGHWVAGNNNNNNNNISAVLKLSLSAFVFMRVFVCVCVCLGVCLHKNNTNSIHGGGLSGAVGGQCRC